MNDVVLYLVVWCAISVAFVGVIALASWRRLDGHR